ncbi:MAG: 50S ribosomal protein L35 [Verrucomicrobiota bacterium]|nr:50S ribosomal protein L35 [Verrucomicrobiota bacterium]
MPKQKTNKAVAKRVKITGTGKLMHFGAGKRHLLSGKSRRRKRRLKRGRLLAACEMKRLARLIG